MKDLGKRSSISEDLKSPEEKDNVAFATATVEDDHDDDDNDDNNDNKDVDDDDVLTLETDSQAATTAAALNLSLGSSGSLFTTPSCGSSNPRNESADSQFISANVLHATAPPGKFSPRQSPNRDVEVIEIFKSEIDRISAATQQVSVVHYSGKESSRKSPSSRIVAECVMDESSTLYMDKHLSELQQDRLTETMTCDIESYMANLKETSLEATDLQIESGDQQQNDSSLSPEPQTVVENTQQTVTADIESPPRPVPESDSTGTGTYTTSEKSEDESEGAPSTSSASHHVVIDKKVDKVFKSKSSDKIAKTSKTSSSGSNGSSSGSTGSKSKPKPPRQNIYISPDRSKSQGSSPVRIIKIKSPRTSLSDQGKRLSVSSSRDSSQDRLSTGRRTPSPRRSSDGGGILKRSASPSGGILKRPSSPSKSKSPDRSCLKKLTPSHDCSIESLSPHLSPRNSTEYLSPDRSATCTMCQHQSPRNSFDSRSSEPNLDLPRSSLKSPRGSFESRSPDRGYGGSRKRSVSAHANIDNLQKTKTAEAYYQYYPIYDNRTCSDHYVSIRRDSDAMHRRASKSLERSMSRDSTTSSSYRYGVSPERIYTINNTSDPINAPMRSQSAENTFSAVNYRHDPMPTQYYHLGPQTSTLQQQYGLCHEPQCPHDRPYQLSSSAPEHTTCMDCLYQKRPS